MTEQIFQALMVLFGEKYVWWYYLPVDVPEWTDPKYNHQN